MSLPGAAVHVMSHDLPSVSSLATRQKFRSFHHDNRTYGARGGRCRVEWSRVHSVAARSGWDVFRRPPVTGVTSPPQFPPNPAPSLYGTSLWQKQSKIMLVSPQYVTSPIQPGHWLCTECSEYRRYQLPALPRGATRSQSHQRPDFHTAVNSWQVSAPSPGKRVHNYHSTLTSTKIHLDLSKTTA